MELYEGKVALVTGSRKGLGESIARHFLCKGASVVGLSRGHGTIEDAQYRHIVCDVTNDSSVRAVFADLGKTRLDVLVNNAGVALGSNHCLLLSPAAAKDMLLTNLLGPFLVAREAARVMKRSGGGRIISIGSMSAVLEPIGDSIYAATKSGLATMTNVLAKEFSRFNITCNTVGVTAVPTDMLNQLPDGRIESLMSSLPIPRLAELDDIFNVIDFFVSERSSCITAQTIYLGGLHS